MVIPSPSANIKEKSLQFKLVNSQSILGPEASSFFLFACFLHRTFSLGSAITESPARGRHTGSPRTDQKEPKRRVTAGSLCVWLFAVALAPVPLHRCYYGIFLFPGVQFIRMTVVWYRVFICLCDMCFFLWRNRCLLFVFPWDDRVCSVTPTCTCYN